MKELKPTRENFQIIVRVANQGTPVVCICKTNRHITAFTGALVREMFTDNILPWKVWPSSDTTIVDCGEGTVTLVTPEIYASENFPDEHKPVEFV